MRVILRWVPRLVVQIYFVYKESVVKPSNHKNTYGSFFTYTSEHWNNSYGSSLTTDE